jgi:hypothetical protein
MMNKSRADLYTKIVLTMIAVFLGVFALLPIVRPAPVRAESAYSYLYVEPGVTSIRKPDGSSLGDGKIMINLRNGDVWGFPTNVIGARYPIDVSSSKPAVSEPVYLGNFHFSSIDSRR